MLEIGGDLQLNSIGFAIVSFIASQVDGELAQAIQVACVKEHALNQRG